MILWWLLYVWMASAQANEPIVLRAPLAPAHQADVYVYHTGIIDSVYVQVGDAVAPGDTLATLDDTISRQTEHQAQRVYQAAQRRLQRSQALHAQGGLSTQTLEAVAFQRDQAQAAWQAANRTRQANVLLAPLAGLVSFQAVQPRAPVSAYQRLFQLIQIQDLIAVLYFPANQLAGLAVGTPIHAQIEGTHTPLDGCIRQLSPIVDPASSTCRAEVLFPQAGVHLRPGQVILVRR